MSKNILLDGTTYSGISTVQLPTTDGGSALFKDVDEISTPSGTLTITENGTHDVRNYANVLVDVASSDGTGDNDLYCSVLGYMGPIGAFDDSKIIQVRANAFNSCKQMTSLSLLSATTAYDYAVANCIELISANLPKCTSLSAFVFNGCKVLTSVNVPIVEAIGASCFYTCSALAEISLPKCTLIKSKAFGFCTSLTKVTLGSSTMCVLENADAFRNINKTVQICVPAELVATYQADSVWSAVTGATLEFVAIS